MAFTKKPKSTEGKKMVEAGGEYLGSLPIEGGRCEYYSAPKAVAGLVPTIAGGDDQRYAVCVICKTTPKTMPDGRVVLQETETKRSFGLKFSDATLDQLHGKRPCSFCGQAGAVVSHSAPGGPVEICRKCLDEVLPKLQADAAQTVQTAAG